MDGGGGGADKTNFAPVGSPSRAPEGAVDDSPRREPWDSVYRNPQSPVRGDRKGFSTRMSIAANELFLADEGAAVRVRNCSSSPATLQSELRNQGWSQGHVSVETCVDDNLNLFSLAKWINK